MEEMHMHMYMQSKRAKLLAAVVPHSDQRRASLRGITPRGPVKPRAQQRISLLARANLAQTQPSCNTLHP